MLKSVTNINDLSKALIELVDFEAEFQDLEELVYNICAAYGAEEDATSYSEEISNAETDLEKLKIFKGIRDNYYNTQFESIEKSDNTKRKITNMKKKLQNQKDDLVNAGYGGLYEIIENYTNQLQNEIKDVGEICEIIFFQEHYAWGSFGNKYFVVHEPPIRGIRVEVKEDAVKKARKLYGYFVLLSNEVKDSIKALELYRTRDVVEKAFGNLKERLNCRRMLTSSELALEGKLFVEFVALIYLSYIKGKMQENGLFSKYTMRQLLDERKRLIVRTD